MEDALAEAGRTIIPAIAQGLGILLMAVLAWATTTFQKKTGLVIEAQHRDALHTAIMSGVSSAAAKLGDGVPLADVARAAVAHAQASVPDAIRYLKPASDVLLNIALAKVEALIATKAAPAVVPIADINGRGL